MAVESRPLILHVIHQLATGGLENGLVNLINQLPESRFRHAVACIEDFTDFRRRLRREDTQVIALHRSRLGVWRLRQEIYRLCHQLRPTIVHSRNQSGLDALLPARLAGVSHCVHGEHGWDVGDLGGKRFKPALLRRLHSPLVDRYITVSRDLREYLIRRVHVAPKRVIQIINGVDTDRFCPPESRPAGLLPEDFRGPDRFVIGTVGRLQPVKDQATLLRAFARLVGEAGQARTNGRLVIVGDGPLRDELLVLARSLGVADRCWFAGNLGDVAGILQALDVFVLPSLAEGISNTLLEAMATGLPLLATNVGGNVELVSEGLNGHRFRPGDVAALTRLLGRYLDQPALRAGHGRQAREMAVARFGLPRMVDHYQAVYEDLCHSS